MSSFITAIQLHIWLTRMGLQETAFMFTEYGLMITNGIIK